MKSKHRRDYIMRIIDITDEMHHLYTISNWIENVKMKKSDYLLTKIHVSLRMNRIQLKKI